MAYSMTYAEQEAQRGRLGWKQTMAPNLDPSVTESVFRTIGDSEGAQRAAEASRAAASGYGHEPKAMAPTPPKATASEAASSSSARPSSAPAPKAKVPQKSMPAKAAPKPSRPLPGEKPQQTHQWKKKRTDQ